jgi:hypothetical protein
MPEGTQLQFAVVATKAGQPDTRAAIERLRLKA